jgi:tRNA pseudouridine synthase 10
VACRVLGNGRPFALEVIEPAGLPSEEQLQLTVENIARGNGLNEKHDIEVIFLERANRALWESMQIAAEEKDKSYRCIVYSERVLTATDLLKLESLTSSSTSDSGALTILQKTPLRVLHRRSLLTRKRFISQLRATLLNEHYFILSLKTSAGTYVKEFVHGDFGRTVPSISEILDTHADILQLDVTWLYDEFRGGGEPHSGSCGKLLNFKFIEDCSKDKDEKSLKVSAGSLEEMKLIPLKKK